MEDGAGDVVVDKATSKVDDFAKESFLPDEYYKYTMPLCKEQQELGLILVG